MPAAPQVVEAIFEAPMKKLKTEVVESVSFKGFDGKTSEYCPYTETSKAYDGTRAPLGLNIVCGSFAMMDKALHEVELLDIGCGTGTFLDAVKDKVAKVSGLEYNDGMIAQCRARVGESPKLGVLVQGSADLLPFSDASFDACTINQVIHHFPSDGNYAFALQSFKETYRVLKPGGMLVISTSTPEQQRDAFWWLSLFPRSSTAVCKRFPPLDVLQAHLEEAGFDFNADSVAVPLLRSLMHQDRYLEHGVKGAFMPEYRAGDSSWSMTENFGELADGLEKLQKMTDAGIADAWLAERELLRKSMGQATFVTVMKPKA